MNWKKEGYNVGDKVYITTEWMFASKKYEEYGTVIYVGTKILKVKLDNDSILEFKNSKMACIRGMWSSYHYIYKSKEEYEDIIKKKHVRKCLINSLTSRLKELSIEELEAVDVLINKKD